MQAKDPQWSTDGKANYFEWDRRLYRVQVARRGSGLRRRNLEAYDDLMADFVRAEVDGDRLTDDEVSWLAQTLFIAGHETTTSSIGNGVASLAAHPDERRKLVRDPGLIPDAIEEMLRLDSPAQGFHRSLTRPVTLHGQQLEAGDSVVILPGSANRDDREFENPDVFDIRRRALRILSFGAGTHACLGLHVAKMEGKVCLEEVLAAWPEYEVDLDRAERLRTEFVQGFASLPIRFEPPA